MVQTILENDGLLQGHIDLAKIHLYTFLLDKEPEELTQIEAKIMYLLSKDQVIQDTLNKSIKEDKQND